MTKDSDLCEPLEWDSRYFGFPVARVRPSRFEPGEAARVLEWCANRGIRCLYFLCDFESGGSVAEAESHGFRLVDARITLELAADRPPPPSPHLPSGVSLRAAAEDDLPALASIARNAHGDSRFFADPNFPRDLCEGLYAEWIRRSVQGWAQTVWVAEAEGSAIGYITCHGGPQTPCSIGLVGVDPKQRGRGIGPALVARASHWYSEFAGPPFTVVTQGRNVRAQRLYQRAGFLTSAVQLWFHRWF